MTDSIRQHCWHENASYGNHGLRCCYCGIRWWEGLTVPLTGHGRFAPETEPLPRPNKPCVPREGKGKGGVKATIDDVDFSQLAQLAQAKESE